VVEQLRSPVEVADGREAAADQPQIEGRDGGAGRDTSEHGSSTRQHLGEDHTPTERDNGMGDAACEEDARAVPVAENGVANSAGRREHVAARCERQSRRRCAAKYRSGGAGRQAVP
jgi:hypothetical protein